MELPCSQTAIALSRDRPCAPSSVTRDLATPAVDLFAEGLVMSGIAEGAISGCVDGSTFVALLVHAGASEALRPLALVCESAVSVVDLSEMD